MSTLTGSEWTFEAIGTQWAIKTDEDLAPSTRAAVEDLISGFDHEWSRFRQDSMVSELAAHGGEAASPYDAVQILNVYAALSEATDGAVNPLIGQALAHRGYDAEYSFTDHGPAPAPQAWQDQLRWDADRIHLRTPAMIDIGAVGKGRLVDRVTNLIARKVTGRVLVDAGGDLALRNGSARIALEHPQHPKRAIGVVEVKDQAICASGTNRRKWGGELHHVLDARTGNPVSGIIATWAIAPEAMLADAIATALFFDGGPELAHHWGVAWVRMTDSGRLEWSPQSTVELFT